MKKPEEKKVDVNTFFQIESVRAKLISPFSPKTKVYKWSFFVKPWDWLILIF